ncbi:6-phosphogluconolactonase-like [Macrosteles quadrilineatus]|uniref:6-phosphogluconolactonase-like n=1 Tax=Macrosteles quadrilineatus TaxID=74068 RepID=UPI0023E1F676|nr:6-phosphogluconolactonase-like [Macrosteles quadrilineatus]
MPSNKVINIVLNESAVIEELSKLVERLANDAIKRDDVFKVGLSGGSLANFLSKGLPNITTEWSKWKLFFCDERVVPLDSTDSTFGVYKNSLIGAVPLSEDQFIKINPQLPAEEAARDYIQKMAVHFPPDELPRFHLLLLGMGPDGHTCSLFPGHRLLEETSVWVAPITDSPKPPPSRVTLTFPVVNNAEVCAFAVSGQGKAEMVKRILKDKEQLPAARVYPTKGQVIWILDQPAASLL